MYFILSTCSYQWNEKCHKRICQTYVYIIALVIHDGSIKFNYYLFKRFEYESNESNSFVFTECSSLQNICILICFVGLTDPKLNANKRTLPAGNMS